MTAAQFAAALRTLTWLPHENLHYCGLVPADLLFQDPSPAWENHPSRWKITANAGAQMYRVVEGYDTPKFQNVTTYRAYRYHVRQSVDNTSPLSLEELQWLINVFNTVQPKIIFAVLGDDDGLFEPSCPNRIFISTVFFSKITEPGLQGTDFYGACFALCAALFHEPAHLLMHQVRTTSQIPLPNPELGASTPPRFGNESGFLAEYVLYGGAVCVSTTHKIQVPVWVPSLNQYIYKFPSWHDLTITIPPVVSNHPAIGSPMGYERHLYPQRWQELLVPSTPWIGRNSRHEAGNHWFAPGITPLAYTSGVSVGNPLVSDYRPRNLRSLADFFVATSSGQIILKYEDVSPPTVATW